MEKANFGQKEANPAQKTPQEKKSQLREETRELKVNDLTSQSFTDVIPKKKAPVVEIIENSPVKEAPNPQDEVEIYSPHLKEKPSPLGNFESNLLPDFVKNTVKQLGFSAPTPIQNYCKPP